MNAERCSLIFLVCHGFPPKPSSDGYPISTAGSRVSRGSTRYSGGNVASHFGTAWNGGKSECVVIPFRSRPWHTGESTAGSR